MEITPVTTDKSYDFLFLVYQSLNALFITSFTLFILVILGLALKKVLSKSLFIQRLNSLQSSNKLFLLVKLPPTNQRKEDAMESLLQSLHRILPDKTCISLEMISSNQFIHFIIVIPKNLKNIIESQIYANYPDTEIEEVSDYLSSNDRNVALTQLHFKKPSIYPISTYKDSTENILKTISAIFSKTEPAEKVFIQITLQKPGSGMFACGFRAGFSKLLGQKHQKLEQDLYLGKLRVGYESSTRTVAQVKLNTLINVFKGLKGSENALEKKSFTLDSHLFKASKARIFEQGDLWTGAEIATIYHFPYHGDLSSNVAITNSKKAPAPDILPADGLVDPKEVSFFGTTNYRNEGKVFGIKRIDRRRHMYVVGKTGSGKSRLLQLLLISDILSGQGCCLLDPHGDLALELLKYIPKERIDDVVYVDPTDRDFPIGFNPLEPVKDYETRQHLATFFIAIFKRLFAASWNPRMEHITRYITLALLETPDSSILGIQKLLADTKFRQKVIMQIQDPVVKSFWINEFSAWNERFANDAVVPLLNKIGQFIANPIVRNMVGQRKNSLDFEKFMNEGKIVIINVSKGKLGDENSALLGSMFITKIQQAALSRAKIPEEQRKDFYFYVDEFQNFATDAFSSILSEARKYHLDLTIAHQYIAQLPEEVKATAFGNVGSLIVFPVGGDDAKYLAREFAPIFTAEDMINLNIREMYIKMSVDGRTTPPFSAKTLDVPKSPYDYSNEIINRSRVKYGKNRVQVENEISQWSQTGEFVKESTSNDFPEPII